jgi:multidrug efflux system membrane fusion protein
VPVRARTVEPRSGTTLDRYSGSLEPKTRVDMAFRVGGYVVELGQLATPGGRRALEEGDYVEAGTVLARIRASDYAERVATASAQVAQARAQATLADSDLGRAQRLFDARTISKAELDTRVAHADAARAEVSAAVARHGEAGVALADTVLRAPIDGVVLARHIELGALVAPGQPALTLAAVDRVKAVFGAPEELVEKLHVGAPVEVLLGTEGKASPSARRLEASITRIAPAADASGRVFSIEAELPNPDGSLRPGSIVSVRVPEGALGGAELVVPLSAVVRSPKDARGFAVFVLDGTAERAKAHLKDVTLGEVLGNSVSVTGGLALRERVVTVGATLLRDGSDAAVIP